MESRVDGEVDDMRWTYISEVEESTGYEDNYDSLRKYNRESYLASESKEEMIEEIFQVYRTVNILPIRYYNEHGVSKEIQKCIDKEVSFSGDVLNFKFNQGASLCRFLFPNLSNIVVGGDERTIYNKFYSDHNLKRAIEFCLRFKKSRYPVMPSGIKDGLEMLGGNVATNFKPMNAKALYERFVPENGVIYDFSCGFGGRMLGALSSSNNYTYWGVEPNTETFEYLKELGCSIESVTGRSDSFDVRCVGSEDFEVLTNEIIDFAFSSPPYFSLEHYCDEETQCYIKFNTIETWLEGYVRPTIENIYKLLKAGGRYAVNIADFKLGTKQFNYVDHWISISKEVGFSFEEHIFMKLQTRRGDGHGSNKRDKKEGIFVFRKVV